MERLLGLPGLPGLPGLLVLAAPGDPPPDMIGFGIEQSTCHIKLRQMVFRTVMDSDGQ